MLQKKREELLKLYQKWEKEFQEIFPLPKRSLFSHPYYLHIPENWFEAKNRILIVGEEGYGPKEHDATIAEAQIFNCTYLAGQLGSGKKNNSAFWRRLRKIVGIMDPSDFSVTWTNLDKIHRSGKGNCRLTKSDRLALHTTPTHILYEEIHLLKPTHVVYFGWYRDSLDAELRNDLRPVFDALYPDGKPGWEPTKIKIVPGYSQTDPCHIFTYHPGWGQRQKDGYEARVLEAIKQTIR